MEQHITMEKRCLIIRSAGEVFLRKALPAILKEYPVVDVLSDRPLSDPGISPIRNVFPYLSIQKNSVTIRDNHLNDLFESYDCILVLLDLDQYKLSSYRKFSQFARDVLMRGNNEHSSLLYCFERKQLVSFSTLMRILVSRRIYRFLGACLYIFLVLMRPLKPIILAEIRTDRIGHLAGNNDIFLRRKQLTGDRSFIIGFVSLIDGRMFIANQQLYQMLKRRIVIIKSLFFYHIVRYSSLYRSRYYRDLVTIMKSNECYEFDNGDMKWHWTQEEEERGKRLLLEMGVDSWFVCFHARDSLYLRETFRNMDLSYHDYRDCDIDNYYEAMDYITRQGGYAIRMGSIVEKPLDTRGNPRIIDYATRFRSDFMDIYLSAKCKFFVGNTAGLMLVAIVFNVPLVSTNYIPASITGMSARELLLPKKIRHIAQQRFLTFREIFHSEICRYLEGSQYIQAGIEPVENTSQEILDAVIEMDQRVNGTLRYTPEDNQLQDQYREIFRSGSKYYYDYTSRIGRSFLLTNRDLLK